ncbi:hypothetical protein ACQJBY_039139 [Aegilops geniculata]
MEGDTPHPPPAASIVLDDDGILAEILLRAVKTESETPHPPPASVSKVFDDDDLLAEILLRVGLPTTLVRAAAVCRRWLHRASRRDLLRRFRERHPCRLLGFYVVEVDCSAAPTVPRFVPVPPQPLELAAVVRRAASSLGAYMREHGAPSSIMDCRNGSLLMRHERHDHDQTRSTLRAHSLLCPHDHDHVVLPGFPVPRLRFGSSYTYSGILSKEEGDGVSYFYVSMQSTVDRKHTTYVYMLQDGVWVMHSLTIGQIPPSRSDLEAVLVANKIYMPAGKSDVVVLDLTASSFSMFQLPQGVEHVARNIILSRADDDAGVYVINVKEHELRIWLHKGGDWLLVDRICLRDMLAGLSILDGNASLQIKQVGDNAEFVLLEMMSQYALFLDIKCRTLRKVYEVTKEDQYLGDIHPFMMIWPPTFPALKDDPATARDAV